MNETNWSTKGIENNVTEKDITTLKKAKLLEKKRKTKGWRYVKLKPTLQIFVPCDKDGNPTEQGMAMINEQKAKFLNIP